MLGSITWASRIADPEAAPSDGGLRHDALGGMPRCAGSQVGARHGSPSMPIATSYPWHSVGEPGGVARGDPPSAVDRGQGAHPDPDSPPNRTRCLGHAGGQGCGRTRLQRIAVDRAGLSGMTRAGPYAIDDPVWWTPRRGRSLALDDLMHWQAVPAAEDAEPWPPSELPRLGSVTAARKAMERPPRPRDQGPADGGTRAALSEPEHRIVDLLAEEPWLSATDIARIEDDPREMVQRRLLGLAQRGVASAARRPTMGRGGCCAHPPRPGGGTRGFLRRATQFAAWTSLMSLEEPPTEVNEHQAGVSRARGLLAAAARRAGWSMTWYTEGYWTRELQLERPRHDGMFLLQRGGRRVPVGLLEYERALPGGDSPLNKLAEWAQWYAGRRWHRIFGQPPLLLFVYGDYGRAPGSLVRAVEACSPSLPICVGHELTLDEHGLDGEVWRRAGGGPQSLRWRSHARLSTRPRRRG